MITFKKVFLLLTMVFSLSAFAESKHPRVTELESHLNKEALSILKGRFPEKPFLVNVSVIPLFREQRSGTSETSMPYIDDSEEIKDEWDDPSYPIIAMIGRSKSIKVEISLPSDLTDDDVSELKKSVFSTLGLVQARDEVEISKRNWGTQSKSQSNNLVYMIFGGSCLLIFMLSLWFVTHKATSKITTALEKGGSKDSQPTTVHTTVTAPPAPRQQAQSNQTQNANVNVSDPFKNRKVIAEEIKNLENDPNFPCLEDVIMFNNFAKSHTSEFGAVLQEFSQKSLQNLFKYSNDLAWIEAIVFPGDLTMNGIHLIEKSLKNNREINPKLQKLLISIFRLGDQGKLFFNGLDQSEGLSLLSQLPKNIALPMAKSSYPGVWGLLFNPTFKTIELSQERITILIDKAREIVPFKKYEDVLKYKKEKEIIEFIQNADFQTEKEIYITLGADSFLTQMKQPFYKLLESNQLSAVIKRHSIQEVALASFNLPMEEKLKIEACFEDKFKIKLQEMMKKNQTEKVSNSDIYQAREKLMKDYVPENSSDSNLRLVS
jgi:hypothetical protein